MQNILYCREFSYLISMLTHTHFLQEPLSFDTKSFNYKYFRSFLPQPSVLCDPSPMVALHRRTALPMFYKKILNGYFPVYKKCANVAIEKILSFNGEPFDCMKHNALLTLDVLLEAGFGYQSQCQTHESDIPECFSKMNAMVWRRTQNPILWVQWIYDLTGDGRMAKKYSDRMHSFCYELLASRREALKTSPFTGLDEVCPYSSSYLY